MNKYIIWDKNGGVLCSINIRVINALTTRYAEFYGIYMFGDDFGFVQLVG